VASRPAKPSQKPRRRNYVKKPGSHVTLAELYPVAYATGCADVGWASGLFRDDFSSTAFPVTR
jgi:hypothetical protein